MRINSLKNNINFGLVTSDIYQPCKNYLLKKAKSQGKENEAQALINSIERKEPNAFLTISNKHENFILYKKKPTSGENIYNIGKIDPANPIKTLTELDTNLTILSKSPDKLSKSHIIEEDIWMYPYSKIIEAGGNIPEDLKKIFDLNWLERSKQFINNKSKLFIAEFKLMYAWRKNHTKRWFNTLLPRMYR